MQRSIARLLLALAWVPAWSLPAPAAPPTTQDRAPAETVRFERYTTTLHDEARDKDLQLRITVPRGIEGPVPTVVFSHGMFGSGDGYDPLIEHWASHGLAVIQPTHADSIALRTASMSPRETRRFYRELRTHLAREMAQQANEHWLDRDQDIRFVLDHLGRIEQADPAGETTLDRDRLGVGGHSFGAGTTMLIGSARPRQHTTQPLADPRPRALLLLSPQGVGKQYKANAWDAMTRPAMTVTGDNDRSGAGVLGPLSKPATWRRDPFDKGPAGNQVLVWVDNADHSLGGITGVQRQGVHSDPDQLKAVLDATLTFWQATLGESKPATGAQIERAVARALTGQPARVERREP